jgi:MFS family permease
MIKAWRKEHNVGLFRLIYLAFYSGDALFNPYLSLYLISIGFSDKDKGIALALIPIAYVFGNFFYSLFATSLKRNMVILKISLIFNILTVIGIGLSENMRLLFVLIFLAGFNNGPYIQIEDGTASVVYKKKNVMYFTLRIFGSTGYMLSFLMVIFIISKITYTQLFFISGALYFLAFIMLFFIYIDDTLILDENKRTPIEDKKVNNIWKNPNFIVYFLMSIITLGFNNIGYMTNPIFLTLSGLPSDLYSLFGFVSIASEVVTTLIFKLIFKKMSGKKMMVISVSFYTIEYVLMSIFTEDIMVAASLNAIFRGLGTGIFVFASIDYMNELFKGSAVSRALAMSSMAINLTTTAGNFIAPYIYGEGGIGFRGFYIIMMSVMTIGTIAFASLNFKNKKEQKVIQ